MSICAQAENESNHRNSWITSSFSIVVPFRDATCPPLTGGQQIEIANRTALPFQHIKNIGHGSSAVIELVSHKTTKQRYALKTFRRFNGRQFENDKRAFENEVRIMKRLSSHKHIVTVLGSYVCDRELGILMSPAASDGDLAAYLFRVLECGLAREQEIVLNRAFGCLINGLAYIHEHIIRHKDIKPQNILVHHGTVLYTDFGFSFHADENDTTTVGYPGAFTPRYCAPEVQDHTSRNRKSDVFSLGCVFLEILDALEPEIGLREMDNLPYVVKLEKVRQMLLQTRVKRDSRTELLRICYDMLEPNQAKRIDTSGVLHRITKLATQKGKADIDLFCSACSSGTGTKYQNLEAELIADFTNLALISTPSTDAVSSPTEPEDESKEPAKKTKKKKKFSTTSVRASTTSNTSRLYCTLCGELGHKSNKCPNECWACGELYHKSDGCPNKCWNCDEVGHLARDCPLECDDCGETGHATDDCPNTCWTCGDIGHFARNCPDECFVCGQLGHATQDCKGRCHRCGKIGHWSKDCGDACFECEYMYTTVRSFVCPSILPVRKTRMLTIATLQVAN